MATVKKYNLDGQEVGTVSVPKAFIEAEASSQLVKDYIVSIRANARQWNASTKGRSEVNHSTKKPHAQKGGGRSRQGSLAAPQYKGGGRVFTPRPKFDQHVKVNQKQKRAAIRFLLSEKIANGTLFVLDNPHQAQPQTKAVHRFLQKVTNGKRSLILLEGAYDEITVGEKKERISVHTDKHENLKKSIRNLEKADCTLARDVNGYNVICATNVIVTEKALQELEVWLSEGA